MKVYVDEVKFKGVDWINCSYFDDITLLTLFEVEEGIKKEFEENEENFTLLDLVDIVDDEVKKITSYELIYEHSEWVSKNNETDNDKYDIIFKVDSEKILYKKKAVERFKFLKEE